jgi:hypothetical protein
MRKVIMIGLLSIAVGAATAAQVDGHVRQDGTYVPPHYRTNPNDSRLDNYSTQGNVNPYTGQAGTVDPYRYPPIQTGTPQPRQRNPYR